MHAFILGVAAVLTACTGTASAQTTPDTASCAPQHAAMIERFISAECSACWTDASTPAATAGAWLLDWIVPTARGDDAPLSPAAPDEAAARARRALNSEVADGHTTVHRSAARRAGSARLTVVSGPAFNGYLGVQIDGRGRAPSGSSVWVALVESVPAGTDGTPVPRQLVRTVAGPFQPRELRSGHAWRVLQAMRWPETARPERLHARAWIERADGRVVVMAGERCAK
jgi:hypothetical protein